MRGILAAGVVIAVTALAGCTDDPEPRFEEPSESPSASESTSAAADPQPWEEKSKAGAVAFARHWIDVFNEAQATGETSALKALSAEACKSCQGYIGQLDALYADGGHLETSGWKSLTWDLHQARWGPPLRYLCASIGQRRRWFPATGTSSDLTVAG